MGPFANSVFKPIRWLPKCGVTASWAGPKSKGSKGPKGPDLFEFLSLSTFNDFPVAREGNAELFSEAARTTRYMIMIKDSTR